MAAPLAPRSDQETAAPAAAASSTALDARTPAARVAWTASTSGSRGPVGVAVVEDVAVGEGAATASVEALPAVGAGALGDDVHAATAPTAADREPAEDRPACHRAPRDRALHRPRVTNAVVPSGSWRLEPELGAVQSTNRKR